ncbi:alpha/beta fold hydrolase, partial [Aeromonas veronii]
AGPDMWAALDALNGVPTLVVRGERSDILSAGVAERMVEVLSPSELVTVPRVGHTPLLTEPEALAGIGRLLDRVTG